MDKLDKIFDSFVASSLFKNKVVLQSNYSPENILHRTEQIETMASILGPTLKGERASNLFLYGKTGSGKTLSVQHIGSKLEIRSKESNGLKVRFLYINCKLRKVSDTEYRIIAELIKSLGEKIPATGLPTDSVYSRFVELIDNEKQNVVL